MLRMAGTLSLLKLKMFARFLLHPMAYGDVQEFRQGTLG